MRKALLTIIAVVFFASTALAAQGDVGVVNIPRVIQECEAGQQARDELKKNFKPMQEDLDRQKSELEQMRTDLQNQSLVLSQEAKVDKEGEFKRRIRDLQDAMQTFQRKYKIEEKKLTDPIIQLLMEVIQDYGKKNGFSMIVDGKGSGVLFVDDKTNITNKVIVELNKAWRAKNK